MNIRRIRAAAVVLVVLGVLFCTGCLVSGKGNVQLAINGEQVIDIGFGGGVEGNPGGD